MNTASAATSHRRARGIHLAEQKEKRDVLAKWGNDLRQTIRTLATPAGVSEFDARLLMNHAIPGVNQHRMLIPMQKGTKYVILLGNPQY